MSRSFQVSKWEGELDDKPGGSPTAVEVDAVADSTAMDVDAQEPRGEEGETEIPDAPGDESDDDEDGDDPADVAMVPMADMLNARFESENVSIPALGTTGG